MLEASVVIATRDRAGVLQQCLASLGRQSARGRFEVIVVDNGSADDTQAVIAAATRDNDIRTAFVDQPNRAKARNAGIALSRAETVVFCDDDTLAPEGFVEAHLSARARDARSVVSGPIVNVPDAGALSPVGPKHYSRAFLCTCNASVGRMQLEAVGGFDESYDLYGWEDTDLGVRLRRQGARRAWSWDAYLYHLKPPQEATLEKRVAQAREKGAMAARFVRKSPTLAVRLATGAYSANFVRASLVGMLPLRSLYQRMAKSGGGMPALAALAGDALVDAEYVGAMRAALRQADA
jgi:glycosyltransferase involved in cell wall biosynthesis